MNAKNVWQKDTDFQIIQNKEKDDSLVQESLQKIWKNIEKQLILLIKIFTRVHPYLSMLICIC